MLVFFDRNLPKSFFRLSLFLIALCCFSKESAAVSAGDLLADRVPATCDENFWNVLTNRAWESGQREVTQNGNLLAKPDSVLVYSCFDWHMDHLANYADDNYPGNPNETFDESFLGIGDLLWDAARLAFDIPCGIDPFAKNIITLGGPSINMQCALEILVLDTMVNNVSVGQILSGTIDDAAYGIGLCTRNYYIEDSTYHHRIIGNRGPTTYMPDNDVNLRNYNCNRMSAAWDAARCYNAITEPTHDGYFTFAQYTTTGGDYRTHIQNCSTSSSLNSLSAYLGLICDIYFHGIPAIPINLYWPWSGTPPLTWAVANAGANPIPAGAMDPYLTVRTLYEPGTCAAQAPIRTGVVVTRNDGTTYDDAYCMAPGCWYNPAVSTAVCQPY